MVWTDFEKGNRLPGSGGDRCIGRRSTCGARSGGWHGQESTAPVMMVGMAKPQPGMCSVPLLSIIRPLLPGIQQRWIHVGGLQLQLQGLPMRPTHPRMPGGPRLRLCVAQPGRPVRGDPLHPRRWRPQVPTFGRVCTVWKPGYLPSRSSLHGGTDSLPCDVLESHVALY